MAPAEALSSAKGLVRRVTARHGAHLRHVQGREAWCGVRIQCTGTAPREDAVQRERVNMYVQIERPTEPLDHGDRAPTGIT